MKLRIQYFGLPGALIFLLSFCFFGCSSDEEVSPSDPLFPTCSPDEEVSPSDPLFPTGAELESLIAQAIDAGSLQERSSSGENFITARNQETPYTGWVKNYHDDDEQIEMLLQMHCGKNHGKWIVWHENGQKAFEGTYKDEKLHGAGTRWHENGQKAFEGTYKDEKLHGAWTFWYENGQKTSEGRFVIGAQDGAWTFWYENGQKAAEGIYKDGKRNADWLYWTEDGERSDDGERIMSSFVIFTI